MNEDMDDLTIEECIEAMTGQRAKIERLTKDLTDCGSIMEQYRETILRLRAALEKIAGHEPGITEATRQMIALQALNQNIKPT